MMLGELITALEREDPKRVLPIGFRNPHSYRGYYHELSFEPAENVQVGEMLAEARRALGATYDGYKGGYYTMDEHTNVWLSPDGSSGGDELSALLLGLMLGRGVRVNEDGFMEVKP